MKTTVGLAAMMVLLVMGCATTHRIAVKDEPGICTFLGEVCHELQPGARGEASLRWVNPESNPTQCNKVILEVVGFFGTEVSKVSPADQERLTALFQQSLTDALATKYQVAGSSSSRYGARRDQIRSSTACRSPTTGVYRLP